MSTTEKLFVETAIGGRLHNGICFESDIREATEEEIQKFKANSCNHSSTELLVYEKSSWLYNFMFCAVCDKFLGMV